jgi:hypothetical protein
LLLPIRESRKEELFFEVKVAIEPTDAPCPVWKRFNKNKTVGVEKQKILKPTDKFFVLGSCFAQEIRKGILSKIGAENVFPDFGSLRFDPDKIRVDGLPTENHMNYYNSFSILQELERCLGMWDQAADDYWFTKGQYQDPYRRLIIGESCADVHAVTVQLTQLVKDGFAQADHFLFTFGMTEVFFNFTTGKAACQKPGYGGFGGKNETSFRATGFAENLDNVLKISDLIYQRKPEAKIFVTVSPVALARTFSGKDICVANTLSKATLRTVLSEASQLRSNIIYFPSYEAVMLNPRGNFKWDGRHVTPGAVNEIVESFFGAFMHHETA